MRRSGGIAGDYDARHSFFKPFDFLGGEAIIRRFPSCHAIACRGVPAFRADHAVFANFVREVFDQRVNQHG